MWLISKSLSNSRFFKTPSLLSQYPSSHKTDNKGTSYTFKIALMSSKLGCGIIPLSILESLLLVIPVFFAYSVYTDFFRNSNSLQLFTYHFITHQIITHLLRKRNILPQNQINI